MASNARIGMAGSEPAPAYPRPLDGGRGTGLRKRRWIVGNVGLVALLLLVLLGFTSLHVDSLAVQQPVGGDGVIQALFVAIFLGVLLGSGALLTRNQLFPLPLSLALLIGYCLVTLSWAIDPLTGLRRLVQTSIVIWVIFRCVRDLGYARTLTILRYVLIALLVVNYLFVFLVSSGVHNDVSEDGTTLVGNWRGILPHKNVAGVTSAFTILLMLFNVRGALRYVAPPVIVAAAVFLYFSESKTSEAVLVISILCGVLVRPYSTNYRTIAGVALLVCAGGALLFFSAYSEAAKDVLNDPQSLTGRGSIWPLLIEYIGQHPWTGAGFGSFWLIGDASPIWSLTDGWVAHYASHGHNGYLDLAVTIGLPGLAIAMVALVVWPLSRLTLSQSITKPQRSLLLALFVFCVCHNLTESSFMSGGSTVQVFLMITIALIYNLSNASAGSHHALRLRALTALRHGLVRGRRPSRGRIPAAPPRVARAAPARR